MYLNFVNFIDSFVNNINIAVYSVFIYKNFFLSYFLEINYNFFKNNNFALVNLNYILEGFSSLDSTYKGVNVSKFLIEKNVIIYDDSAYKVSLFCYSYLIKIRVIEATLQF